ncbi:hypothetical protein FSP39_002297 [Pinctada imbricata]|uniref:Uncharacterized protein n=1 Tax=Pinctada imbricata TaxID=66713 RepID=A0AA88XCC0_PINIB|nr:hypothetical protein FSP39_002297 [Pinctada imbricata]
MCNSHRLQYKFGLISLVRATDTDIMKHIIFLLFPIGYLNAFLFNNALNPYEPLAPSSIAKSQCHLKPADIIFVLDDSGSVGYNNFEKELQFVQGFAKEFDIGPLNVQVGVVTYSSSVHEYIRLNSNRDKQSLLYNINRLPYQSGLTRTADAINLTLYHGFSQPHGDRDSVTDVMMVITDGQSQDPRATAAAARRAHNAGIKTFAIGVGNRVKATEMDIIASDKNHVFHVSNYDALQQLKEELRNKTCEAIAFSNLYCQNNIKNCNSYGHVVCVNYAQWGRQNCPLYCGYCAAQGTPPPPTSSTSTTTTTTTTTTKGICEDKFGNCNGYGNSVCTSYRDWSIQNCAKFCQFCHAPAPPCVDLLGNCAAYGATSCQFYKKWAELNCAKTCGVCGNGIPTPALPQPTTTPLPTTTTLATTTFKGECIDHLHTGSCESYGPDICYKYREWAYKQCPKFCLFCKLSSSLMMPGSILTAPTPPTTEPPCVDVDPDCEDRGPFVCFNNKTWAETNCRVFCTFCTREYLCQLDTVIRLYTVIRL